MGLFKPYDAEATEEVAVTSATPDHPSGSVGGAPVRNASQKKSLPTPTRKQAEEARRQRIQPILTKKQARSKEREARYKARDDAMSRTHAKPVNGLIRDWVDRRFNLAEFMLPAMLLVLVLALVGSMFSPVFMEIAMIAIYGLTLVLIVDTAVMVLGCRRQLKKYFPNDSLKGTTSYALSRAMLMRRSREPKPRVKRFQPFQWPNPTDLR